MNEIAMRPVDGQNVDSCLHCSPCGGSVRLNGFPNLFFRHDSWDWVIFVPRFCRRALNNVRETPKLIRHLFES